jgi:hypothetical protein
MKWLGQYIYDLITRFRSDVYLESLSTTSETNVLVVDSNGKVSKSTSISGASTYTHNQSSESNTWTITHNLGRFPSVTVIDSGNTIVKGTIVYNSNNQLTVTFFSAGNALATTGKAYLN